MNAPQKPESADVVDEALAEIGRQARTLDACSICWAYVDPDLRNRHLDWHASLVREFERERGLSHPPESRTTPGGTP